MANISDIFGGPFVPPPEPSPVYTQPPEVQLIDAIASAGYVPPSHINFDGKVHRFSSDGRKKGNSGWYVAFDGKIYAGAFGCWKDGSSTPWRQDIGRELSTIEQMEHAKRIREARAAAEEDKKRKQETAQGTASEIWSNASEASDDHPYLQAKGVKSHGLRVSGDGRLIVPMINTEGEISSLQFIPTDGEKKYLPGGSVDGCIYAIHGKGDTHYIAEGYATAATVHEVTGATVYVAFSAGQLSKAAANVRQHHAGDLVIVADNDASGVGQKKANEAATEHKARVILPPIEGMDANDYEQAGHDISALLNPPQDDWLIPADDFASKPAPIRWLIKNHIQSDALIMVHGPSGGGKTFVVLDQCLTIASNRSTWCGNIVHGGAVVYLAGEGHHGLRGRVAAWKQYNRVDKLNMWLSRAGTDLNTPEGYNKVRQALLSLPETPRLVVVDTLHRFLMGDENSAQDAKTMLDACNAIQQEFECAVLLVHHTGVSDEAQHRARGSSAWKGALDIEISVVPGVEDKPLEIIQRKSKDTELAEPIYMRITSVELPWEDEDGEAVTSAVVTQEEDYQPKQGEGKALADARRLFEAAWIEMGDLSNGVPYLTESAWREFHRNANHDKKPGTIRVSFKRHKDSLIDGGYLASSGAGFTVKDPIAAMSIAILKK
jgi:putative DNA primase/helicase